MKTINRVAMNVMLIVVVTVTMSSLTACITSERPAQPAGSSEGGYPADQARQAVPAAGYPAQRLATESLPAAGYPAAGTAVPGALATPTDAASDASDGATVGAPPAVCGEAKSGFQVYYDARGGYCLQVPDDFLATAAKVEVGRQIVTFSRAPQGTSAASPSSPSLSIEVLGPAQDRDATALADEVLAQYLGDATGKLDRSEARIGGEPAVVVDGVPGMWVLRQAFFVHGGLAYSVIVTPWNDTAVFDVQPDSEVLWQAVVDSLIFEDVAAGQ